MSRMSELPTPTRLTEWVFSIALAAGVAALWVGLYKLNTIFFESIGVSRYITWIFLPAAIRMISVMLLDWIGAAGLFVGAIITSDPIANQNLSEAIALAGMSALGPVIAVFFCTRWLRMPANLSGLGPRQLTLFGLVGALCNVIPHNIYFYVSDRMRSPLEGISPMFVGDLLGTVIILYVCALVLKYFFPERKKLNQPVR